MYPQHLDRLHDDGSVRRIRTGGGRLATTSSRSPEVPASAPVLPVRPAGARRIRRTVVRAGSTGRTTTIVLRPDAHSDAWPLPVADGPTAHRGSCPTRGRCWTSTPCSSPAPRRPRSRPETRGDRPERSLTPEALLSAMAAGNGPRHRRPSTRTRRPSLYLAAALIGVVGVGVAVSAGDGATPPRPTSR